MDPIFSSIVTILLGAISSLISTFIAVKMNRRDKETYQYRHEQEEKQREKIAKQEQQNDIKAAALRSLLRLELVRTYKHIKIQGYYPLEEREVYHPIFQAYKNLDGDGIIDRMADEIVNYPIDIHGNKK